jgi:hypothetical protein
VALSRPWPKGVSGNPAGKPKGAGRNARCAEWAKKWGLKFLEQVAEGKVGDVGALGKGTVKADLKTRTDVTKYLIDRGLGKPMQVSENTIDPEVMDTFISALIATLNRLLPEDLKPVVSAELMTLSGKFMPVADGPEGTA